MEIAGRDVGLPPKRRHRLVMACVREYREAMRSFARASHLDVWYERLNASELVDRFGGHLSAKGRIVFAAPFARARRKTSLRAVKKLTEQVDGELRFRSVPPLLMPFRELFKASEVRQENAYIYELLDEYAASLRFVDMARKVVGGQRRDAGVGAPVRRSRWPGPARAPGEAGAGVRARGLPRSERVREPRRAGGARPAHLDGRKRRVPRLQRSLGLDGEEHDFYVRQLWDWKASADLATLSESGLLAYTRACGWSLARMHARSGDRLAIAAYVGAGEEFDRAIARFCAAYADQNEHDHARLAEAAAADEVPILRGI